MTIDISLKIHYNRVIHHLQRSALHMDNRHVFFSSCIEDYPIISEQNFTESMQTVVVPFLDNLRQSRTFDREKKQTLYCEFFLLPDHPGKGTIFISHGFTESCAKYHEVIYYMLQKGYHVAMVEHRGHGRSRTPEETDIANTPTHMEHFQDYVDDMLCAVQKVLETMPKPYYLFAHSMGGAIGAAFLEQHPGIFEKAVFTAPMFEINRHGIPKPLTKLIGFWNCLIGKGKQFTVQQKPFIPTPDFPASPCTSEQRFLYYFNQQLEHPEFQSAGASNRWAKECLAACDQILLPENCAKITIPVLLFQADSDDFVYPGGQNIFINRIANGRMIFVPGSKHEIYMSDDKTVKKYWSHIFAFYAEP